MAGKIIEAQLRPHSGKLADYAAGSVKRFDVPDKTAAMLMAIVADTCGIPLGELCFLSIRDVTEEEKAK